VYVSNFFPALMKPDALNETLKPTTENEILMCGINERRKLESVYIIYV
jgi:hypothetical protein